MSVVVQMSVRPPDQAAFREACEWLPTQRKPESLHYSRVYADENDSSLLTVLQEWDSHDAFHAFSDETGDEFNRRAHTEGLEWETHVWTHTDIPDV